LIHFFSLDVHNGASRTATAPTPRQIDEKENSSLELEQVDATEKTKQLNKIALEQRNFIERVLCFLSEAVHFRSIKVF
jgi:hypothetical protein